MLMGYDMSRALTNSELEALLLGAEREMSPQQQIADHKLARFENGISPAVQDHIDRYYADPSYAAAANKESLARAHEIMSLCGE